MKRKLTKWGLRLLFLFTVFFVIMTAAISSVDTDYQVAYQAAGISMQGGDSEVAGSGVLCNPLGNAWYVTTSRALVPRWCEFHGYEVHSGWDMACPSGTPIYAADKGTVVIAGTYGGYGNCVKIDHGNGMTTLYGHQSRIAVSKGQKVKRGQKIGYVGSTGDSTGPHLHFEVEKDGVLVKPETLVKENVRL